ncbi:MAG: hypothetical protein MK033_01720 [Candidatus Caenarcaniphilales bacterium]|nr:hypothetical protein [Candidatus Caenarcaniphilales bacterium]
MNFTMQRPRSTFQRPDMSISKNSEDKAYQLIENFFKAVKRQVTANSKEYSTIKTLIRQFKKEEGNDPSDKIIYESIKRMEKDKIQSQVAMAMSQIAERRAQNTQANSMVKMIPYFIGLAGLLVMFVLTVFFSGELNFSNPAITRNLLISLVFVGSLVWGIIQRKSFKYDMLSASILHQVCSAYAAAKMQGKGAVGAMQNLGEMRIRAKSMQEKEKAAKKKK